MNQEDFIYQVSSFKLLYSPPSPKIWHHLSKIAPAGFLQNVYFGIWYGYVCLSCLNIMKYLSETEASLVSSLKHWSQTENMTKCWSRLRWRWVELVAGASAQVSVQMKATSCSKYELFGSPCLQSSVAFIQPPYTNSSRNYQKQIPYPSNNW